MTLLGAHTVGRVHPEHSGFGFDVDDINVKVEQNAWDLSPMDFDHGYWLEFEMQRYKQQRTGEYSGDPNIRTLWAPIDGNEANVIIMLNTDMILRFGINATHVINGNKVGKPGTVCGHKAFATFPVVSPNEEGCEFPIADDTDISMGSTQNTTTFTALSDVAKQFTNVFVFLDAFTIAFTKMSRVGFRVELVNGTEIVQSGGKLGFLRAFDLNTCPTPSPTDSPTE